MRRDRNFTLSGGLDPVMKTFLPAIIAGLGLVGTIAVAGAQQRGRDSAPAEGARIPKVSAKTPDGKTTVDISKPERFTVLVFGSYT